MLKIKKKNGYPPCHMTQKFSHSPCRIQTQSEVDCFDESLSSLSRLGWVIFKSLKTWMSHFQVSRDLDESLSSLSRLGWVTFKSLKTWMSHFQVSGEAAEKRGERALKEGRKGTKKKKFTARAVVRWIDRTTARAVHVRSRAASLLTSSPAAHQ